jgi:hypothetical protein
MVNRDGFCDVVMMVCRQPKFKKEAQNSQELQPLRGGAMTLIVRGVKISVKMRTFGVSNRISAGAGQ